MKHRITLSIALVLSVVLLSLMKSDSPASAAPPQRFSADTGIIILGANQKLRVSVVGDFDLDGAVDGVDLIVFKRFEYGPGACGGDGVCKLAVASQSTTAPIRLRAGEAVSFDIPASFTGGVFVGVRGVVVTNRKDVRVNVSIVDEVTGAVTSLTDAWPQKVEIGA